MPIGTQRNPQVYATVADAKAAAMAANTLVWASISGVLYQVYPDGRAVNFSTREEV